MSATATVTETTEAKTHSLKPLLLHTLFEAARLYREDEERMKAAIVEYHITRNEVARQTIKKAAPAYRESTLLPLLRELQSRIETNLAAKPYPGDIKLLAEFTVFVKGLPNNPALSRVLTIIPAGVEAKVGDTGITFGSDRAYLHICVRGLSDIRLSEVAEEAFFAAYDSF